LEGKGAATDSPVLARYSLWGLGWSVIAACFAIGMSLRYEERFDAIAKASGIPHWVIDIVMATLWVGFFLPVIVVLGKPLVDRRRGTV